MAKRSTKRKSVKKTKSVSKTKKSSNKKISTNKSMYLIAILAVVVIGVAAYMALTSDKENIDQNTNIITNKVVGMVNDQIITSTDVQKELARLPEQLKQTIDEKAAVNQIIDRTILEEQILKANTNVKGEIDRLLTQNNLTINQLETNLKAQGFTLDEFESQLKILSFLNKTLFSKITVSDAEIKDFYDNNPQLFIIPETVRAKHILVSFNNRTEEEALSLINVIQQKFEENNSLFCDLVTEYSEDPGSVENCGEYPAFSMQDNFVQEYKNAAFNNEVGQASIAKTQFGYHLIWTVEKIPANTIELSLVSDKIKDNLLVEKQKADFNSYLAALRDQSQFVNCYETPNESICQDNASAKTDLKATDNKVATVDPLVSFAECLTQKGAKIYGAYWCSHCEAQKKAFGDAFKKIDYVECAVEGNPQEQTSICIAQGIQGYPTWEINGKRYSGEQTFEQLAKYSGCEL